MDQRLMAGVLAGIALLLLWVALQAEALWLAAILLFVRLTQLADCAVLYGHEPSQSD